MYIHNVKSIFPKHRVTDLDFIKFSSLKGYSLELRLRIYMHISSSLISALPNAKAVT